MFFYGTLCFVHMYSLLNLLTIIFFLLTKSDLHLELYSFVLIICRMLDFLKNEFKNLGKTISDLDTPY